MTAPVPDNERAELAYAENVPGAVATLVTAALGAGPVAVPGTLVLVPASARPVWLEWAATLAVPAGTIADGVDLQVREVGGGLIVGAGMSVGAESPFRSTWRRTRLGPTDTERRFELTIDYRAGRGPGPVSVLAGVNAEAGNVRVDCYLVALAT